MCTFESKKKKPVSPKPVLKGKESKETIGRASLPNIIEQPLHNADYNAVQFTKQPKTIHRDQISGERVWKKGDEVLARVTGDIASEVTFSDKGLALILNKTLKDKATDNGGKLKSEDILQYIAEKSSDILAKDKSVDTKKRKLRWQEHKKAYNEVILAGERIVQQSTEFIRTGVVDKEVVNQYKSLLLNTDFRTMVNDYAGKDFLTAVCYVLLNVKSCSMKDKNFGVLKEHCNDCKTEIERRLTEMYHEYMFCVNEADKPVPDNPTALLQGNDCGGFAQSFANLFEEEIKEGHTYQMNNYSKFDGYSSHYFIYITGNYQEDGGVTAETCVGKGGPQRVVFSIRPGSLKPDSNDSLTAEQDKETITNGYHLVNKEEIGYNKKVLEYYLRFLQDYLSNETRDEKGKIVNLSREKRKNNYYLHILRFYNEHKEKKQIPPELKKVYKEIEIYLTNTFYIV